MKPSILTLNTILEDIQTDDDLAIFLLHDEGNIISIKKSSLVHCHEKKRKIVNSAHVCTCTESKAVEE